MMLISTALLFSLTWAAGPKTEMSPTTSATTHAAAPTVAGRVMTELTVPLPGGMVTVQGTAHVISTNADGDVVLPLADVKTVTLLKCQGYRDQTLAISADKRFPASMYSSSAPAPFEVVGKSEVLSFSEVLPAFPGGDKAFRAFLGQNAHFPKTAWKKGISGTAYVRFIVDEQGRITDAEVVKSAERAFDKEALRVIRLMPWWIPGQMAGKPVRVSRVLPIPFVIKDRL